MKVNKQRYTILILNAFNVHIRINHLFCLFVDKSIFTASNNKTQEINPTAQSSCFLQNNRHATHIVNKNVDIKFSAHDAFLE